MKPAKKSKNTKVFECWKCFVFFYVVLFCISGVALSIFSGFLLILHQEIHTLVPARALYLIIIPLIFAVGTTFLGWSSIRRKNHKLVKVFSVLLGITAILETAGGLWCFASLQSTQQEIILKMSEKFSHINYSQDTENDWNFIQKKFKCCGFHGLSDYQPKNVIPFSCCGSDDQDIHQGSCSLVWQKGCNEVLVSSVTEDFVLLGLTAIIVAFLQIPGIFISWCFANRLSKETI